MVFCPYSLVGENGYAGMRRCGVEAQRHKEAEVEDERMREGYQTLQPSMTKDQGPPAYEAHKYLVIICLTAKVSL